MKTEIIHFSVVPFLATTFKIYAYLLSMMLKSTLNLTRSNFTFCLNMNQICKLGWNHWYYFNGEEMTMAENDNGRGKVSYVNLRIITQITHSNTEGPHLAEFDCPQPTATRPLSS